MCIRCHCVLDHQYILETRENNPAGEDNPVPAGSDRIIWFHVLLFAWSQQNNTGLQFAVQQPATDLGIHPFRHFPTGTYYGNEDNRYRDRLGRRTALYPDAEKRRFGFRCFYGETVYVETCPHYLALDESLYYQENFTDAARYVCAPPLREKKEADVLWKALRRGEIQTVSTDHCSFTLEQKEMGREDFTRIPGGLPGVETRGELMWSLGVAKRKLSVAQMCRVLSENPAKLYGLFPRKGTLQPGADADIVVYDPSGGHVIRGVDCESAAGYSPYEGFAIDGGIRQVWLRGRLAVESGNVLPSQPEGKYMARGKCML